MYMLYCRVLHFAASLLTVRMTVLSSSHTWIVTVSPVISVILRSKGTNRTIGMGCDINALVILSAVIYEWKLTNPFRVTP